MRAALAVVPLLLFAGSGPAAVAEPSSRTSAASAAVPIYTKKRLPRAPRQLPRRASVPCNRVDVVLDTVDTAVFRLARRHGALGRWKEDAVVAPCGGRIQGMKLARTPMPSEHGPRDRRWSPVDVAAAG